MSFQPSRRTVAKGAAWSLPAVMVSVPAAAYAATAPGFTATLALSSGCELTVSLASTSYNVEVTGYTAYLDGQPTGEPVVFPSPIGVDGQDSRTVYLTLPGRPGQYMALFTVEVRGQITVEPTKVVDVSPCFV